MSNGNAMGAGQRIACAPDLGPVREELRRRGYQVEDLPQGRGISDVSPDLCAVVITGLDDDFMGTVSMNPDVPVLRAEGKTPDEVAREVEAVRAARAARSGSGIS